MLNDHEDLLSLGSKVNMVRPHRPSISRMKFTAADFCAAVEGLSLQPNVLTRCPDQWVGNVECSNQGFEYLKKSLNVFSQRLCIEDFSHQLPLKRLILVLESPHVDEFENYSKTQFPAKWEDRTKYSKSSVRRNKRVYETGMCRTA